MTYGLTRRLAQAAPITLAAVTEWATLLAGQPAVWAQASLLSPTPLATAPAAPATPAAPPVATSPAPAATPAPVAPVAPTAATPSPAAPPVAATPAPAAPTTAAGGTEPQAPAAPPKPKRKAPPTPPRETALSTDPEPTLNPETFFATAKASEHYAAIADAGGWPDLPRPVSPHSSGKDIATLRLRLAIEGDLSAPGGQEPGPGSVGLFDTTWGSDLTEAVKRFQERHGLKPTGVVAGATLKAMNVTARVRFTELASSAQRLAGRNFAFGDRYVVVNIPSAAVEAVENGRVTKRFVAVVGDPDHASPEVDAKVQAVNLNPTWTVPTSIIKNEIIPKMQRDPGYLSRAKIRILDGSGNSINPGSIDWTSQRAVNYILRQDSGAANSLGAIRINMPNKFAVYMHDTPSKRLFGGDYRFLSHGCVRVQGVYDLAAWLLEGTGSPSGSGWNKESLEARVATGQHEDIKLSKPVPVAWVYLTGWASASGVVNFRDDVYGLDTVGSGAQAQADGSISAIAAKP